MTKSIHYTFKRNIRAILILAALTLLPFISSNSYAQRVGKVDSSFNYGLPSSFKFDRGVNFRSYNHNFIGLPSGSVIVPSMAPGNSRSAVTLNKINPLGNSDLNFRIYKDGIGEIDYLSYVHGKVIVIGPLINPVTQEPTRNLIFDTTGVLNSFNSFRVPDSLSDIQAVFPHFDGKYLAVSRVPRRGRWVSVLYRINTNGEIDNTFSMFTPNLDYDVSNPLAQTLPDGSIIFFSRGTNNNHQALVKLNQNGTQDLSFNNPYSGLSPFVKTMQLLPNGNILLAGRLNGPTLNQYKQLSVITNNGLIVPSFNANYLDDYNIENAYYYGNYIYAIGTTGFNRQALSCFRFIINGTLDTTYHTEFTNFIFQYYSSVFLPNKGWIVNGFKSGSLSHLGEDYFNIDLNGKRNNNYKTYSGANGGVYGIKHLKSGKMLIHGQFNQYGNATASNIVRVNANGLRDTTFKSNLDFEGIIDDVIELENNSLYILGTFRNLKGKPLLGVARLFEDGTLDTNFYFRENFDLTNVGFYAKYFNVQANGSIVVHYNGETTAQTIGGFRRYFPNGSIDSSLMVNSTNATVYQLPSGKFIIGNGFYRINNISYYGLNLHGENGEHLGQLFNTSGGINTITKIELHNDSLLYFSGTDNITQNRRRPIIGTLSLISDRNSSTGFRVIERARSQFAESNLIEIRNFEILPNNRIIYHQHQSHSNLVIGILNQALQQEQIIETSVSGGYLQAAPDGSLFILGSVFKYQNKIGQGLLKIFTENVCTNSTPPQVIGNNEICIGQPVTLRSSANTGNIWNTGDTTSTITVSRPGSYYVRQRGATCISDYSQIFNVNSPRSLSRPNLRVLRLNGGTLTIYKVQIENYDSTLEYQWSNGNTGSFALVSSLENLSVRGNSNGCLSETSFPLTPLSAEISISDNLLELYPNPAKNSINVTFPSAVRYRILNTLGQTISEGLLNQENTQIDIQGFKSGYYIFQTIEGTVVQKSFIKQ